MTEMFAPLLCAKRHITIQVVLVQVHVNRPLSLMPARSLEIVPGRDSSYQHTV